MKIWIIAAVVMLALGAGIATWMRKSARSLVRARRLRIDRFKLRRKHADIRLEVFGDKDVVTAVRNYARDHKVPIEAATRQAHLYLTEIVPKFNLLAYYRFGAPVARAILYFLYRVVVARKPLEEFNRHAPKDAVVVYVINHRSNVDYVLVAHMLFKFVSLSYAVGEWARVWPLNHIFKWFGGYFVRRRYREPLYHAVLRAFVQTITRNGVTQGIFIEGGLSRNGAFLEPKLGMLDYIVTSKRSSEFQAPLFIIPTAISYDRTLEDRTLTEELMGKEDRSTRLQKLGTSFDFLFRNFFRSLRGRFKRYGYAAVSFGEPILVDDVIREDHALVADTFDERKPAMKRLAGRIMESISAALPVTPVPVVASVFAASGGALSESEVIQAVREFRTRVSDRVWLTGEQTAEEIWEAAKRLLLLRHLIEERSAGWCWNPDEILLRDYYANALVPYGE
ncbi:MAG TPA: 1-acyl-sn-glycerol-3-phosphate acyltransferase [Thermoanaerobaculia bacterium]|nr:1-acyl-sn-glycerol-3-phosphate acyltransferase [Thermoanaerobaculia bacterium]